MSLPMPWLTALAECQQRGIPAVLVTVLRTAGSTPRECGSKMLVTAQHSYDSIGGGHLEYQSTLHARTMLDTSSAPQQLQEFNLGADLGQCCGGKVQVLFERLVTTIPTLTLFGAGHVAKALLPLLIPLPINVRWVDSREELFPVPAPDNVEICVTDDPVGEIPTDPAEHWLLIMTHNHQLDFELVRTALANPHIQYLGVIGSDVKARRFQQRLAQREFTDRDIARMICPVGERTIPGKTPHEVAISITAQLIQQLHQQDPHEAE